MIQNEQKLKDLKAKNYLFQSINRFISKELAIYLKTNLTITFYICKYLFFPLLGY